MSNRFTILAAALLSFFALFTTGTNNAQAQNRRAFLEEFTGSWCGYCVRGSYCIETLKQKYGDKVAIVSYHNGDPMSNAQGDSTTSAIGGPAGQAVPGFPDSW